MTLMKTNRRFMTLLGRVLPLMTGFVLLSSCGVDNEELLGQEQSSQPASVVGIYNSPATRAITNNLLTSFSLYCFDEWNEYTNVMLADNILWTLNNNVWSGNSVFYMSDWSAMYGYGVSPSTDDMTDVVFKQTEQAFTYTNPTEKGVLVKMASKRYFTKEETNNRLMLTFNDALYTLFFQAYSGFQPAEGRSIKVEVKEITLHNTPNQARFTFDSEYDSWGSWALTDNNQFVSNTQTLATPAVITPTSFTDIQNEPFVLFPIQPDGWDYYGMNNNGVPETFAQAKTNDHCYVEVKMRIIEEDTDTGKKYYLWGYADDDPYHQDEIFESAFYPYLQWNCTASWSMSYNGYYYLFLDDNGVDKEGLKITPHPEEGGSSQFKVSAQIDFRTLMNQQDSTADPWEVETEGKTVNL